MNPAMLPQATPPTGLKGAIASTMFGKKKKKSKPSASKLPASVAATAPIAPMLPR